MGLIFNGNGDVIKAVDGSLTVEGIDLGGSTNINAGIATFSGNVNVGGVLTYEDVKNVDSVGVVTARAGIVAQSDVKFANQSIDNAVNWGKVSNILQVRDGTKITFGNANDMQLSHNGSDSVISQSASGTGNLKILSGGAQSIECVQAGAVNIAHNGNTKLATTSTGVTVTGDITISDKIIHAGDTNTAIRFPAADTFSVETAGQQNVQVNGTRVLLKSPSGTDTTVRLQHQGNSGYGDIILDRTVNAFIIDNDPSNASNNQSYFSVKNKGTENLRITSSGRVSVGNLASPDGNLHVHNSSAGSVTAATDANELVLESSANVGMSFLTANNSLARIKFGDPDATNAGIIIYSHADDSFRFQHTSNERLRIDSSGHVMIGTTTEGFATYGDQFTIANSGHCGMTIRSGTSSDGNIYFSDGTSGADEVRGFVEYNHTSNYMNLGTNGSARLRITSAGLVGIGNNSPNELLSLRHATSNTVLDLECLAANDGTTGNIIKFRGKGANGVSYHASQIKGITENGANNAGFLSFWTNSAGTVAERLRITSGGQVQLPVNGQELAWGASQQFRMFWENSEERMYLKGNGAYGIAFRVNNGNRMEISKTTGDIIMQGTSGRNFQWDNSEPSLYLTDNGTNSARLKIGSSGDLQMYHDVGSHLNFITCATNADLKVSTKTLQVFDYTGGTKKFETTNRGKVLSYHADTAAYGASNWARTGTGNQSNSSQASPEGSFQFQSNTGNGTMRFKSYIQATSANQTDMYIHLNNSGFYRITIEASHNSQGANVAMYLVYGLANMNAVIQQVTSSGNFSATTQNTHVNSHDTTLKIAYSGSTNQGMRALVEQIGGF